MQTIHTIVPVVLYACEEHTVRLFQNMLLEGVFEPKRGDNRRMKKTAQRGASDFINFTKYY
jgi:hypothetical protein